MPEELPKGWVKTTLGEIRHDESIGISQEQMRGETFELYSVPAFSEGKPEVVPGDTIGSNKILVSQGDVLLCKINPRINRAWVVGEPQGHRQIASTEWIVFSKQEGISSDFLCYFFSQDAFRDYLAANVSGVGGSLMRVRPSTVVTYPFTLPPAAEQKRIVEKLNAALSGLERAENVARRTQERLQRYRAAVLEAAVTGELTREWREAQRKKQDDKPETADALLHRLLAVRRARWQEVELQRLLAAGKVPKDDKWKSRYPEPASHKSEKLPALPEGWTWVSLDQIGELNRGKSKHRPRDAARLYGGPYPFIQTGDIRRSGGTIREHTQTYSEFGLKQSRLWPAGTLCITIAANIAETGILSYPACFPDSVVGFVQMDDLLKVRFVEFFIRSEKSRLERYAPATAQKNINLELLSRLAIPLPPLSEQIEIVREAERRLLAADRLAATLEQQLARARATRESLLREAFAGRLVSQDPNNEESASVLLEHIRAEIAQREAERKQARRDLRATKKKRSDSMQKQPTSPESLSAAWERIGQKADARRLFDEAGLGPEDVVQFYEALSATPKVRVAFQEAAQRHRQPEKPAKSAKEKRSEPKGCFRLVKLWLEDFKNLKDYTVRFDPTHGLDVVLGWNGTGKSNLFEALVIIFRDLHGWWDKNRWPSDPMKGFRLRYEIDDNTVEVTWYPDHMKRPELKVGQISRDAKSDESLNAITRKDLPLPRFLFGYYSGPTNRLAEHFLPMKQAHYERLRKSKSDDPETLASLLEQRRFFCAETHHAKYVLLAFCYKEDPEINRFLEDRLRIVGFESALFIIRKPRWHLNNDPRDFWGATGIMRRVMERLRRYAIAPMVLKQIVNYGYQSTKEDHYFFFLPDIESLYSFAAEYQDARTFFLALESTDFSELIHDVKIQVRVKATNTEQVSITFHQLSEGEQQLLMVLGLMRFTKSHQSLVLLDEPDTHLNPHWSVNYLKDLTQVMSDNALQSPEQQSSQTLMATHDPLVIASLVKEQIHLLKRDSQTGACRWTPASVNPRGLGFTGILTSEMFGFRSDLDPETLVDLDNRVRLIAKEGSLTSQEKEELENIDKRLTDAGFSKAFSDPYYSAFVRAWGRRHSELMAGKEFLTAEERQEIDRIAGEVLKEAIAEVEKEVEG